MRSGALQAYSAAIPWQQPPAVRPGSLAGSVSVAATAASPLPVSPPAANLEPFSRTADFDRVTLSRGRQASDDQAAKNGNTSPFYGPEIGAGKSSDTLPQDQADKTPNETKNSSSTQKTEKEKGKESEQKKGVGEKGPNDKLEPDEQRKVNELKKRDAEVKAHEQAHIAAGGPYVRGGANYEYERGPDNRNYAVGGEVSIDVSPERTPEATIRKMQVVRRAALAPRDPSGQDRAVAAQATQLEAQARQELQKQKQEESQEKQDKNKVEEAAGQEQNIATSSLAGNTKSDESRQHSLGRTEKSDASATGMAISKTNRQPGANRQSGSQANRNPAVTSSQNRAGNNGGARSGSDLQRSNAFAIPTPYRQNPFAQTTAGPSLFSASA